MREDTVVELRQAETFSEDSLTEVLRLGPRIRFTSAIPPPYLRRAKSIEGLLPSS